MINLESEFSPRVNPADANYPFGSIKDNSSPGANDGTPLAAVWGNDWEGFAQAAMTEAGITPSGLPDTAQDSQLLAAVKVVASGALRPSVIEALRRSYAEAGYNLVDGSFEAGGTLVNANDVLLQERTGRAFSGPAGPVVAGTNPVGDINWKPVTDQLLREDLAAEDSDVLIAGVAAKDIAALTGGDNYTYISPSAARIDKLTKTLLQSNTSIVITGDSLSFNGFGYDSSVGADGGDYATNNPFGLSSWAHLLRDAIFTSHAAFQPVEKCRLDTGAAVSFLSTYAELTQVGINSKVALLTFANTSQSATLVSGYSGLNTALIVSYAPADESVLFDVNGTAYDNTSPTGHYKGRGYMLIPLGTPAHKATITNVRKKSNGAAGNLLIYGCGSTDMTIAKLTGKGAWTSGQILAEYPTLVAPYSPDIIYYIIGANDISSGVPIATFDSNVRQFIANARAAKPNCEIVLLSTPPTSSYTRAVAKPYIKEMRKIAEDTGSSLIDLWSALEAIPTPEYRFDNIHFNTQGDTLVFSIVRKLTLPTFEEDISRFHTCRESFLGAYGRFYYYSGAPTLNLPVEVVVACTATPAIVSTYPSSRAVVATLSYITINGLSGVQIVFPADAVIHGVSPLVRAATSHKRVELNEVMNAYTWRFVGIDSTGAQVALSNSDLYFMLSATLKAVY